MTSCAPSIWLSSPRGPAPMPSAVRTVDLGDLTRLEGAADRAVRRLGIKPGSNAPKPMSILEYAAKKAAEQAKILLREAGCYFVRQGRGDHEIWHSPISGINFTIDNN